MNSYRFYLQQRLTILLFLFFLQGAICFGASGKPRIDAAQTGDKVRLFFTPKFSYYHPALVFVAVSSNDQKMGTASLSNIGWSVFIPLEEMQSLIDELSTLEKHWRLSSAKILHPESETGVFPTRMTVKIYSSRGIAEADIPISQICKQLKSLESKLHSDRAIWEMQVFRQSYECPVTGIDRNKYPDHF
jgi:hypothetical protein